MKTKKLEIPVHTFPVCIDYCPFISNLEKVKGYNVRDFAGTFSKKNEKCKDSIPYLDFWHWMLDGPFSELHRGGVNYLSIDWYDGEGAKETPEFVKIILKDIFEAVKDHPAFDGECIHFYVDW